MQNAGPGLGRNPGYLPLGISTMPTGADGFRAGNRISGLNERIDCDRHQSYLSVIVRLKITRPAASLTMEVN